MESVLVGVDRSESSERALRFALRRSALNQWSVTVAHVINWSRYSFPTLRDNELRPQARRAELDEAQKTVIDPLIARAEAQGSVKNLAVDTTIRHGRPSEVLSELAVKGKYDIIIVGRTGESHLKAAIFGSTASRLVQHADIPVVVVP